LHRSPLGLASCFLLGVPYVTWRFPQHTDLTFCSSWTLFVTFDFLHRKTLLILIAEFGDEPLNCAPEANKRFFLLTPCCERDF
jgi:hypothetical protein